MTSTFISVSDPLGFAFYLSKKTAFSVIEKDKQMTPPKGISVGILFFSFCLGFSLYPRIPVCDSYEAVRKRG